MLRVAVFDSLTSCTSATGARFGPPRRARGLSGDTLYVNGGANIMAYRMEGGIP